MHKQTEEPTNPAGSATENQIKGNKIHQWNTNMFLL